MESILLVVQVVIALGIIGLVLIQRNDQDGLSGLGGGGGGFGLISGRAKANLLTRATAVLAALFMLNSLALTILVARSNPANLLDKVHQQAADPKDIAVPVEDKDQKNVADPVEKPASEVTEPTKTAPIDASETAPSTDEKVLEENAPATDGDDVDNSDAVKKDSSDTDNATKEKPGKSPKAVEIPKAN